MEIHNAKGASVENCRSAPIWKNDFGFKVDRFPAVGDETKAIISVSSPFPLYVVVSFADGRNPRRERGRGRVEQAKHDRNPSYSQARPPDNPWNARSSFGSERKKPDLITSSLIYRDGSVNFSTRHLNGEI